LLECPVTAPDQDARILSGGTAAPPLVASTAPQAVAVRAEPRRWMLAVSEHTRKTRYRLVGRQFRGVFVAFVVPLRHRLAMRAGMTCTGMVSGARLMGDTSLPILLVVLLAVLLAVLGVRGERSGQQNRRRSGRD
jgi:hypothetical protein